MSGESMAEVLASLPADLRPAARDLSAKACAVTGDAEPALAIAFRILREAKGAPERLDAGSELLDRAVADRIVRARDEVGTAGARLSGTWVGGGAEAFADYVPKLTGAMRSVADSAVKTAAAVRLFREALTELWRRIVERTRHSAGEVTAAVAQAAGNRADAVTLVLGIVDRFAAYVGGIAGALLNLANSEYKATEKLDEIRALPGVVDEAGVPRLPLPADTAVNPAWSAADRKDNWRPGHGDEMRMDTAALAGAVTAFRGNGVYWDEATRHQTEAAEAHLTVEAFGLGLSFYGDVRQIITRDRRLYRDANARMDAVADALGEIGGLYGMIDDDTTSAFDRHTEDQ